MDSFLVEIEGLRFRQNFVKRTTIEAKKCILHLQTKYGDNWRAHAGELRGYGQDVIREVMKIDLHLPVVVTRGPDFYAVSNGVHTSYAWREMGQTQIRATLDVNPFLQGTFYTFEELRVE